MTTTGLQGSHVLGSVSRANCLIARPLDSGGAERGGAVDVIPFPGFM